MISVAIPTMGRWDFLKESLPVFLAHKSVLEVIVCDETGEDVDALLASPLAASPKLRLVKNKTRLGIYQNKRKVAGLCTGTYVALLDSDNYFSDTWLDQVADAIQARPTSIIASADFKNVDARTGAVTNPCAAFSGLELDAASWNAMFQKRGWNFLLNDGNWVVPRAALAFLPASVKSESLLAADAIYMLRAFVKGGFKVWYVPELSYIHTVHAGSSWLATERDSERIFGNTDWCI